MERFIELVAEILEVDSKELSQDTYFRDATDSFDSMMGFMLICMMEDEYGTRVSVDNFLQCKTIGDLFNQVEVN